MITWPSMTDSDIAGIGGEFRKKRSRLIKGLGIALCCVELYL